MLNFRIVPQSLISARVLCLLALVAAGIFLPRAKSAEKLEDDKTAARLPHTGLPSGRSDHAADLIDAYFQDSWAEAGVEPAPGIDDAGFLRRASLALNGQPATHDELTAFLADTSPDKRSRKADELLTRSRYADYWAFRLRDWITSLREVKGQGGSMRNLYIYTREAMAENRSWKEIAHDLLASQGNLYERGEVNFAIWFSVMPNEYADAASRFFLGTNLACAQCHDHPTIAEYKRESYWGLAAFFARTTRFKDAKESDAYKKRFPALGRSPLSVSTLPGGNGGIDGGGGETRVVMDVPEGELEIPDPKKPVQIKPTPLGEAPIDDSGESALNRRERLVAWMTEPANPYFARAAVNRFWVEFTGRGFVDGYDGFTPGAKIRHPKLLETLAGKFLEADTDLKWLMRTILLSRAFQLEHGGNVTSAEHWQAALRRPLNSDQWFDSVLRVTGEEARVYKLAEKISPILREENIQRLQERRQNITRAIAVLKDGGYTRRATRLRLPTTELEPPEGDLDEVERAHLKKQRDDYYTLGKRLQTLRHQARNSMSATSESLMRMNGKLVSGSLESGKSADRIAGLPSAEERLNATFMTVLGRRPTSAERERLEDAVSEPDRNRVADLMWALIQSTEFQTY